MTKNSTINIQRTMEASPVKFLIYHGLTPERLNGPIVFLVGFRVGRRKVIPAGGNGAKCCRIRLRSAAGINTRVYTGGG